MTKATCLRPLAAVLLMQPAAAAAQERATGALEWAKSDAAAECIEGSTLAERVQAQLHRPVFVDRALADLVIKVRLDRPDAEDWTAAIDLEDPGGRPLGHRDLKIHAPQCSAMDDPLALVVSLMVDVTRESVRPRSEPPPSAPVAAPPAAPRAAVAATMQGEPQPPRFGLFLLGGVRFEQPPGVGRGVELGAEAGPARGWLVTLAAAAWAPAQTEGENAGARFSLQTAEINLCGTSLLRSNLESLLCIGQQLGRLQSTAFGFDENRSQTTFLYDLTLRWGATFWATSAFGVRLNLGAAIPLVQDEFFGTRADGSTLRLLSRPPLVPLGELGIVTRFGR